MSVSVSIIIVNYNGGDFMPACLDALSKQTYENFEIIIVDNNSHDGSLELVNKDQENLSIIELKENTGFAYANNRGVEKASGEWIALLNNDAFPDEDWLEKLMEATTKYPDYDFFSSHQYCYNEPHLLDGTGDMYATNGRAWRRDYLFPVKKSVSETDEVFGACAAASFYRKKDFDEIGGFDEDYFCHFEDVDLSFRLRLSGRKCLHVYEAVVYHIGSATAGGELGSFALYQGYRNSVWTYLKCMPAGIIIRNFHKFLWQNMKEVRNGFRIGKGRIAIKSKFDSVKGLPKILAKRRKIQKAKRITNAELLEHLQVG